MALKVRRVVTAHDAAGKSKVAIDETCANVISRRAGHESCVVSTGPDGTIYSATEFIGDNSRTFFANWSTFIWPQKP